MSTNTGARDTPAAPTTQAGRDLLDWQSHPVGGHSPANHAYWLDRILAIEAEARSAAPTTPDLLDAVRIILINEVPSDEAWRDLNDAYDAALAARSTPAEALEAMSDFDLAMLKAAIVKEEQRRFRLSPHNREAGE